MNCHRLRAWRCGLLSLVLALGLCPAALSQSPAAPVRLEVAGDVQKPLSLSLDDLRRLPHKTIKFMDEQKTEEVYGGVPIEELLKEARIPQGAQLRGRALGMYVLAEGSDGYRVVFFIAELDADFQDSEIVVADTLNGAPIPDKLGPFRLVVPHDKRAARSVRTLTSIKVVRGP
ncbi:MAG TPA: molybdopterin-dependent oxidoreductase [Candidatus Acidoferrales bacterium]|nr:molybdopterin-dependent oxidoreductase [Candidatus Acidoferrales bacterium]